MSKSYRYTVLHDGPEKKTTQILSLKKLPLDRLQELVGGGYIEALPHSYYPSLDIAHRPSARAHIYINEDGKFRSDLTDNLHFDLVHEVAGHVWLDPVHGPAVIEEVLSA